MDDSVSRIPLQISIRDRVLNLSTPQIMGILNATPDSFSDGGQFNEPEVALSRIGAMIKQGASIIDIGGASTRPGSEPITEQEELARVMPIIKEATAQFPDTIFSIDTTNFTVAEKALQQGVHMVNDISGLQQEPRLAQLCAHYKACYILMHSQGDPKTMQDNPYYDDVIEDINLFFTRQLEKAKKAGLENIILDPGIGFGKTLQHNITIIKNMETFKELGHPILIGASRKSMINEILGGRPMEDRVVGTVAVHHHAMLHGANVLRVHDVKEANDAILVYNALSGN